MIKKCQIQNSQDIKDLADFLTVISEENRLRIICFLEKNGEQCVCEIWKFLKLPQNLVSHHLKVLRDFGLLDSRRDGLKIYYSVNKIELKKHRAIFNGILTKGEK